MSNLRAVVSALLSDLTAAQHRANRLTRKMAESYQSDAVLQHLPVPRATVEEMELTLHFAVESVDSVREEALLTSEPPNPMPNHAAINRLANQIAGYTAGGLAEAIENAPSEEGALKEKLVSSLSLGKTRDTLAAHIAAVLRSWWDAFTHRTGYSSHAGADHSGTDPTNDHSIDSCLKAIAERLTNALRADDDLRKVVGEVESAVAKAVEQYREDVVQAIRRSLSDHGKSREMLEGVPSLNVILDGKTLARLPDRAIQSATFKFDLSGYRSISTNDEQHLIPEE